MEEIQFLRENFSENDNSVSEYKDSLIEYLKNVLNNHPSDWSAMSDYTLYLQGAEQMLKEVIREIN